MELLERQDALIRMRSLLGQAERSAGSMLLVGGEAGIGKTVLVQRFTRDLDRTARVLFGACDPLSTPRPLGPLHDIAAATGGALVAALAGLHDRATLFGAVLNALSPAGKPVVAVIEDAHWADEATLDLLRYLGRRIAQTRALLLVTYRDDEVGPNHPLRLVLGDLATAANVERMAMAPLSVTAVTRLAAGSDVDATELHRLTGGNPFFVTEVLAAGGGVPSSVRDAVLSRAARLTTGARSALDAAAVIGPPIDPDLLLQISGTTIAEIDENLNAGVLKSDGAGLAFRHELGREAVLGAVSPPRRVDLHRRVLTALIAQPAERQDLTRISHHAEEAGDRDAVLRYAPLAAERSAGLGAHREAAAHDARALRFAGGLPDDDRAPLLEGRYREHRTSGNSREALQPIEQLIEIARRNGDRLREADWLVQYSQMCVMEGRNAEAERAAGQAARLLDSLPEGPVHTLSYRYRAYLRMLDRDLAEGAALGQRALELAERQGDIQSTMHALNCVGCCLLIGGDEEAGRARFEQVIELANVYGIPYQAMLANSNLGSSLGEVYRFESAEHHLREGILLAERHDHGWHYPRAWLALVHCYRGRWSEATDVAEIVTRYPGSAVVSLIMARLAVGRVRARRGDPDAWTVLDEAAVLAGPTATLQRLGPVHGARAEAAWLAGDTERAAAEASAAYELAVAKRHAWFTGELAYWLWKAGVLGSPPEHTAEPFALQIAGDPLAAARLWDERLCPYEAARARIESDDPAELRAALAELEQLRARPLAQAAARKLRELGVRVTTRGPRQSTRAHPAHLTAREAECLRLIAAGCRNAEIAERLFLSPKTVERHVGSLFAKLDAHSRTEALATANRLGLLDQTEGAAPSN